MPCSGSESTTEISGVRHWHTQDVDEHARALSHWDLRYDQITAGRFHGTFSELWLDGVQLARDRANQALFKRGKSWDGAVCFSMPVGEPVGDAYCGGHQIHAPDVLIARAAALPEVWTPAGLDLLCISVDETLLEYLSMGQNSSFRVPTAPACLGLDSAAARSIHAEWVMLCSAMFDHDGCIVSPAASPAVRREWRDTLLQHLLDLFDINDDLSPLSPTARKRLVDRACEYVLSRPDSPPSILELCSHVGASRRKLQYCFQDVLGTNPVSYLRAIRLNAVRRELAESEQDVSVQHVATQWGFWHLSRFALDYRQLFGEKPSDTLAIARSAL
ncbi:helix-turn-helix domain-containing protein [Pseudomonas sp. S 311-6]|nr:helix-turn-helix domain-containing protein [Pseudomonas sp. S 311-6]